MDDFYVRTWVLPSIAPAICEDYSIFNVLTVKYGDYQYDKGKENSKWVISKNKNEVCFADLNHTPSQANRGGHIICFENQRLHTIMLNAIQKIDDCDNIENTEKSTNLEINKIHLFLYITLLLFF